MQRFNDYLGKEILFVPGLAFMASVLMYVNRTLAIVLAGFMVVIAIGTMTYAGWLLIHHLKKSRL